MLCGTSIREHGMYVSVLLIFVEVDAAVAFVIVTITTVVWLLAVGCYKSLASVGKEYKRNRQNVEHALVCRSPRVPIIACACKQK